MAETTDVKAVSYVATMLGEDPDLLEAIVSNEDNLSYGDIVTVWVGPDDTISALTDDGIDELRTMLADARRSSVTWREFVRTIVSDPYTVARFIEKGPR